MSIEVIKKNEQIMEERRKKMATLSSKLADNLGEIHNRYKLFSVNDFFITDENNIINVLIDFHYLQAFYDYYVLQFNENDSNKLNRNEARNKDLPFIGENVIKNGKADFIFYFEGSLQSENKVSITVLSHLWTTEDETIIDKFCGKNKWWSKANYLNVKNRLAIDKRIVKRSYITDSVRFDDNEKNEKLIIEEINLFQPKLVICIGNKARDLVGMSYYDFPVKFHYVKFPKYHSDNDIYKHLNEILNKF